MQEDVTFDNFFSMPLEYQQCCQKIVMSHVRNELYGAQIFDEPAIALAPTPYTKWLTCRIAMDEYSHHIRFRQLALKMGVTEEELKNHIKRHSSIFEFKMSSWSDFCAIKILADLGEIIQAEDLSICTFIPLKSLARQILFEEKFHVNFGIEFSKIICEDKEEVIKMQSSINRYFPLMPAFFGKANSKNNSAYIKWGIKRRKNEEMLEEYLRQAKEIVESKLNLTLPDVLCKI
jgi:ring-1,2-phenylacetyl-CoA epoxidase subunit PaaA